MRGHPPLQTIVPSPAAANAAASLQRRSEAVQGWDPPAVHPLLNAGCLLRSISRASSLGVVILLLLPGLVAGAGSVEAPSKAIEAAFLRNFFHYVTWPDSVLPDSISAWQIGILGPDPFGEVLEYTLDGRTEQDRPFRVHRAETLGALPRCHIIFISIPEAGERRLVLGRLEGQPVLTVGDSPGFLEEGGIVHFDVGEYVKLGINLDRARSSDLVIQTKMLEVAHEIIDGGTRRKRR